MLVALVYTADVIIGYHAIMKMSVICAWLFFALLGYFFFDGDEQQRQGHKGQRQGAEHRDDDGGDIRPGGNSPGKVQPPPHLQPQAVVPPALSRTGPSSTGPTGWCGAWPPPSRPGSRP